LSGLLLDFWDNSERLDIPDMTGDLPQAQLTPGCSNEVAKYDTQKQH